MQLRWHSLEAYFNSNLRKPVVTFYRTYNIMEYYNDFLSYLSEVMTKIQELLEKVTIKHNEAAICLLETSSLYNPQILIDLAEMTNHGTRFDEYILEGEKVKDQLEKILAQPQETTDYYQTLLEDLGIVEASFSEV